ncbi:MAG: hypothetical protein LBB56_00035 [Chitinispirillales bacterium]|jgi:hypothetical protein|nr:hypothetical protein [Chitinispirillales bacterium]
MKRLTIVLAALGALVMFLIYCTKVEFDNPVDSNNLNKYLDEKLCDVSITNWPIKVPYDDGIREYWDCYDENLRRDAVAEDVPGLANILNPNHPINTTFNEDRTPTKVTITRNNSVDVREKDVMDYNKWVTVNGWEDIGIKVEPEAYHERSVVVVDEHGTPVEAGNTTPKADTYYIWYIAKRTLNDGTVYADTAKRTLVIYISGCTDDKKPTITLIEPDKNPMALSVTTPQEKFKDPGARARTDCYAEVEFTRTFNPASVIGTILKIQGGDTLVAAEGKFTITYTARNPDNTETATVTRNVEAKIVVTQRPKPVIVLTQYKFGGAYGDIESVDTVFRISSSFREPGFTAATTPQAAGIKAYYISANGWEDISDKVKANYSISTASVGQRFINYTVDAEPNVHEAATARRAVFITDIDCDETAGPLSVFNGTTPLTIPKDTEWNGVNTGWTVTGRDDYPGSGTNQYRLVGYNGLDPVNPQPGTYTLKLLAVGTCGTVAPVVTRVIIVE